MGFKLSTYNVVFEKENGEIWLFNTSSGSIISLTEEMFELLNKSPNEFSKQYPTETQELIKLGFIIDEEIDELTILKYLYWKTKFNSKLLHLTVVLTKMCNFNCIYCFEEKSNKRFSDSDINGLVKFIDNQIKYLDGLLINWYGGEPLLEIKTIEKLVKKIKYLVKDKILRQTINTNGYLLTLENYKKLKDWGVKKYVVPIDGPKEYHDQQRPLRSGLGTYDKIMDNLIKILEFETSQSKDDRAEIQIRVDFSPFNIEAIKNWLSYEIPKIIKDNVEMYFSPIIPGGERSFKEFGITYNQLIFNEHGDVENLIDLSRHAIKLGFKTPFEINPTYVSCGADISNYYVILPDLKVSKCPVLLNEFGFINSKGELVITDKKGFLKWMTKDPFNDTSLSSCKTCKLLPICGGGCTKVYFQHNKAGCRIFKTNFAEFIKVSKDAIVQKEDS